MTPTDHDLLIELCQKVDLIYVLLTNHLEHHFWYNMTLLGGFIATVTSVILYWWGKRRQKPTS